MNGFVVFLEKFFLKYLGFQPYFESKNILPKSAMQSQKVILAKVQKLHFSLQIADTSGVIRYHSL